MFFRTRIRGTKWVVEFKICTAGTTRDRYPLPIILYYIRV